MSIGQTGAVDWTPILWMFGVIGTLLGSLLAWIGILLNSGRSTMVGRIDKHETWILSQQQQLNDMGRRTDLNIKLVQVEQAHLIKLYEGVNQRKRR